MKVPSLQNILNFIFFLILSIYIQKAYSQDDKPGIKFGGNLNVGFTSERFNIIVAPSAVYQFNKWFSSGLGLHFGYTTASDFTNINYGGSLISLFNPKPQLQLSIEFEQMGVSRTYDTDVPGTSNSILENYWYPALFLGAGYRTGPVTVGLRYDVLYDNNKSIYGSAYAPFVRVFF